MMLRGHGGELRFTCLIEKPHTNSIFVSKRLHLQMAGKSVVTPRTSILACSTVQESSPSVAAGEEKKEAPKPKPAVAKPKAAAKAPAKPLPQMMEEDIIPPLKSILEAQTDLTQLRLSFQNNTLEGSFVTEGKKPYTFWVFFTDGTLMGPKGFTFSSHGLAAGSIEAFLVDEKKISAKLVVFWVEKRLAAQGIIPIWKA